MKWYIFCILIGILLCILLNNIDRFSIGGLNERDSCPFNTLDNYTVCNDGEGDCTNCTCIEPYDLDFDFEPRVSRGQCLKPVGNCPNIEGTESNAEYCNWDQLNAIQQNALLIMGWTKESWTSDDIKPFIEFNMLDEYADYLYTIKFSRLFVQKFEYEKQVQPQLAIDASCSSPVLTGGDAGDRDLLSDVAQPYCNLGSGGGARVEVSDTPIPHINLNNVFINDTADAPQNIYIGSCNFIGSDLLKQRLNGIKLHYKHEDGTFTTLNYISLLDEGSFGYTFKYSSTSDETQDGFIAIVIKVFKEMNKDSRNELIIVDLLKQRYESTDGTEFYCDTVTAKSMNLPQRPPTVQEESIIVMELMDGNLANLMNKFSLTDDQIFLYIKEVVTDLKCLSDNGYIYTDLKAENVLYKMTDREPIIRLGDLGSIFSKNLDEITNETVTFPSIESFTRSIIDSDVIWTVGITVLQLLMEREPDEYFFEIFETIDKFTIIINVSESSRYYSSLDEELRELGKIISEKMYSLLRATLCPGAQRKNYDELITILNG